VATKTKKPAEPVVDEVVVLLPPTVEPDAGFARVSFYDEKGKATSIDVPPDHLRNLAKECTRVCSEMGV